MLGINFQTLARSIAGRPSADVRAAEMEQPPEFTRFMGTEAEYWEIIRTEKAIADDLMEIEAKAEALADHGYVGRRILAQIKENNKAHYDVCYRVLCYQETLRDYGLTPGTMGEGIHMIKTDNYNLRKRLSSITENMVHNIFVLSRGEREEAKGLLRQLADSAVCAEKSRGIINTRHPSPGPGSGNGV